ncbi:transcriptional enhancer factor TEF-1-like isoform X4 [Tachypleus tridentatus]|uniref:transcriptional enhancer factor TEF-1-like isoform X4 n=1 Tax=Tachypleus tridentatus TaxID=6853 RepID=UPI003FD43DFA
MEHIYLAHAYKFGIPSVCGVHLPTAKISSQWNTGPPSAGPTTTPSRGGSQVPNTAPPTATPAPPPPDVTGSDDSNSKDSSSKADLANCEGDGVWSPDIEQSFQEALAIYPPCGRRKIILSDEGKMYGRNELIARYIKLRTGKTRTRKQVSSHIQVLARRKSREIQTKLKDHTSKEVALQSMSSMSSAQIVSLFHSQDHASKEKALQSLTSLSSAQIVSASAIQNKALSLVGPPVSYPGTAFWPSAIGQAGTSEDVKPFTAQPYGIAAKPTISTGVVGVDMLTPSTLSTWEGRSIATHKLRLVEFSAFMEQQRDQDSYHKHLFVHIGGLPGYSDPILEADLNTSIQDEAGAFYGVTSQYESSENMTITCSTKVCSFGKQVVEKVETEYARFENGRFVYRIQRSPMCEYMINFIHKLKHLPEKYMMNSVLENFTILQVVTNRETQETLLCIAYVFEVSTSEHGAQHHIYRLVKD